MAYLLRELLKTDGEVLEIGTGSGYQTAVLAEKCKCVVTIDLEQNSKWSKLPENVVLVEGDGCTTDMNDEFDGILVTFAAERISHSWFKQLRDGARLVVPIKLSNSSQCRICVYRKSGKQMIIEDIPCYAPFTAQRAKA